MSRRRMNRTRLTQPIQSKLPIKSQSRIDKDHANPMPIQLTRERARNKFTTIFIIQHQIQYRIATHRHFVGSALAKVMPIQVNRRTSVHVTWEQVNCGDPTEVLCHSIDNLISIHTDKDWHSISRGHSNGLPLRTDIVQIPDGTSTIQIPPLVSGYHLLECQSRTDNPYVTDPLPIQQTSEI